MVSLLILQSCIVGVGFSATPQATDAGVALGVFRRHTLCGERGKDWNGPDWIGPGRTGLLPRRLQAHGGGRMLLTGEQKQYSDCILPSCASTSLVSVTLLPQLC